jgi:hypothetical protein
MTGRASTRVRAGPVTHDFPRIGAKVVGRHVNPTMVREGAHTMAITAERPLEALTPERRLTRDRSTPSVILFLI